MATIQPYETKQGTKYRVQIRRDSKHMKANQSRSFDTKKEAQQWAKQVEQDLKNNPPETLEPQNSTRTLKALIDHYRQKDMLDKEETTQRAQKTILKFWETRLGYIHLDKLTVAEVIKHRDFLEHEKKRKPGTLRQYLALLKATLNVAVKDEWLPRSPIARLTLPEDSPPRERYLTKDEIQRLFLASKRNSNRSFYPFIYLALHSALRYSELINIKLGAIDFDKHTIFIPKTKNKRSHTIYLSDDVWWVLWTHMERLVRIQPENWQGMTMEGYTLYKYDDAYLFPAEKGDKPAYFIKAWRRARKEAGLETTVEKEQVVFHTTRHTTLSILANAGRSDFEIAQIANHKDFRSTRRYTKGDPEKKREMSNQIADLIK